MSAKFGVRRLPSSLAIVALAGVLSWSALAFGVSPAVKGRLIGFLDLVNASWDDAKDPARHGYSFREPVLTVPAEHRNPYPILPAEVVVALLGDPAGAEKETVKLKIAGGRISKSTIVVRPGTGVKFVNKDRFVHKLYAVDQESFPPAETSVDGEREWKVPGPGVYEIRDERAPNLRMWIVCQANVVSTTYPNLKGEFRLPAPEGEFQVQVFFSGTAVSSPRPLVMKLRDVDWNRAPIKVKAPKPPKGDSKDGEKK